MELRQLRTFVAVVEHGGFRRAAAKLHYSQPAVTAHIRDLECSLGVTLFERLPGCVRLTAAGTRFVGTAQRLLADCDTAVASARREQFGGRLTIGTYPGSAAELTRPLIVELRRHWPELKINVVALTLREWAPAIEGVDALIMRDPIDRDRVRATELFAEPLLAAVPWASPARDVAALGVEDFLALPLVRMSLAVPSALRSFWTLESHRNGTEAEFRGYGADSADEVAQDVACGFGAALATASLHRTFPDSRLLLVPISGGLVSRSWLTSRLGDQRAVIDALHANVDAITRRIGPLVLPELAAASPLI